MGSVRDQESVVPAAGRSGFGTTHWSLVVAAGDTHTPQSAEALETLCRTYWPPLYAYVRRQGYSVEEAQDLTQEFFLRLLRKESLQLARPRRGTFRSFLLTSLKHFLISEWRKTERQKRGGGQVFVPWDTTAAEQYGGAELPGELSSEEVYDRRWATTLMERALARLREEYHQAGRERLFEILKNCLWGEAEPRPYATIARELGLTEAAVKTSVHRLRLRCREVLREEVVHTVVGPEEIEEELRHLIEVFGD